jgi:hypothetical protein
MQEPGAYYREKAVGQLFRARGKVRCVLTPRNDSTINFMPSGIGLFVL